MCCTLQPVLSAKFPLTFLLADILLVFYRSDIWVGLYVFSDREIENIVRSTKAQLPAQGTHTNTGMWLFVVDGSGSVLTMGGTNQIYNVSVPGPGDYRWVPAHAPTLHTLCGSDKHLQSTQQASGNLRLQSQAAWRGFSFRTRAERGTWAAGWDH